MKPLHAAAVASGIFLLIAAMVWAVKWAKRGSPLAGMLGSAMLLLFGMGAIADPPPQRIERSNEDSRQKKDSESGEPL
jgi:uncharacterized membrane protein